MGNSKKDNLAAQYFRLARTTALRHLHQWYRVRHHRRRYGVTSAFMFHVVEMEINSMCNRKCSYCPNVADKRPSGYMEEALFEKIINELAVIDFDGRISYHFYGEPLLDKRLPRFVSETRLRVPRCTTEIYSNGDFLSLELFRDYISRGLDNFLITQHDNLIPANLQRILDEATEAEKRHLTIRFAKDRHMINRSGLITTLHVVNEPLTAACDWPLTTMVVTLQGNVVLCCNDYYETEVIGNVRDSSLREVWTSPGFERFRNALSRGDRTVSRLCERCDYVPDQAKLQRIVPN